MSPISWFFLLLTACSLYNCGTVWMTQRVSYPLFRLVGSSEFVAYDWRYFLNIIPVVIIPAFLVMIGSLAFLGIHPHRIPTWALLVNAIFGLVGLVVTLGLEIPRHIPTGCATRWQQASRKREVHSFALTPDQRE